MLDRSALEMSPRYERLSSRCCLRLICTPQPPPHTHSQRLTHFTSPITQRLFLSVTSVPCPLGKDDMCLMAETTAPSTFSAAGAPQPRGSRVGGGCGREWRGGRVTDVFVLFSVSEEFQCSWYVVLLTSLLISPVNKQLACASSKPTRLIGSAEDARDEEENDADLKMSAGVAFLIVHSHYSMQWCAWWCFRLFAYLKSDFLIIVFHIELVGTGMKLKRPEKPRSFFFVERIEAHYGEAGWTFGRPCHSFWKQWGSLSFWRDCRSRQHNLPPAIATVTRTGELRGDAWQHISVFRRYRIC